MKREERNRLSRRRIMDGALEEFSKSGYLAGSMNHICANQEISKGIIYHYYDSKDALFLACVEECFQKLTEHMRKGVFLPDMSAEEKLKTYFSARADFFRANPQYRRIFCDAMVTPPAHLRQSLAELTGPFEKMNLENLEWIMRSVDLRVDIGWDEIVDVFRGLQNIINIGYQESAMDEASFESREQSCMRMLNILLYGVISRE